MADAGDANAKVLRVRALLKRGGKTPVYNTIVRTENVVAASPELQKVATSVQDSHRELSKRFENADAHAVVHAVGAVRGSVGVNYGIGTADSYDVGDASPASMGSWPPKYAVDACGKMCMHATRLEALCHSFATTHRRQPNAENDVGNAIADTAAHLQDAFEQLDDEVFSKGEHDEQMEVAARVLNRRARQLAARATLDAHGEVFASIEFAATCSSLMRAASTFNRLHIGHSLYADAPQHTYPEGFSSNLMASESHSLLAETLRYEGLKESTITNTLARASRHSETAEAIYDVEDAKDPLQDTHINTSAGQPLRLGEWASEAMRTGVAQFDVLGGFSMSLDGNLVMHDGSLAGADWLCLRARTTDPLSRDVGTPMVASAVATAAWRRMRYDAGTYDAPFFRPTEDQLRAAARSGIALCGRGNVEADNYWADADVLVVDIGIAPERLGMVVVGNYVPARATLHMAQDAIGYMFSEQELDSANESVDALPRPGQREFLCDAQEAEPATYEPAPPVPAPPPTTPVATPLPSVPEVTITAREAYDKVLKEAVVEWPVLQPAALPDDDADAVTRAMRAALCVTIRESPHALHDLSQCITQPRTASLYRMLNHKGESAADVAASILGLPDLEPVVAEIEEEEVEEEHEEEAIGAAFDVADTESGTPSSEEFEELVAAEN